MCAFFGPVSYGSSRPPDAPFRTFSWWETMEDKLAKENWGSILHHEVWQNNPSGHMSSLGGEVILIKLI